MARGGGRRLDDAANQIQPSGRPQLLGRAVEVAPDAPRPVQGPDRKRHIVQSVQVALGLGADAVFEVDGAKVDAPLAHGAHPTQNESPRRLVLVGDFARRRLGEANVISHGHADSGGLAAAGTDDARLQGHLPFVRLCGVLSVVGGRALRHLAFLPAHDVGGRPFQVVRRRRPSVGIDRVDSKQPLFPVVSVVDRHPPLYRPGYLENPYNKKT